MNSDDLDWRFGHWLRFGRKNSTFVYYRGSLAYDRWQWQQGKLSNADGHGLLVADRAMQAAKDGLVDLFVQRSPRPDRRSDDVVYLARKR